MSPDGERPPFPPPEQPLLPWLALPLVAGAAGLARPDWAWIAIPALLLAWAVAQRFPAACRAAVALAALGVGGLMHPEPPTLVPEGRLLETRGTVNTVLWGGQRQAFILHDGDQRRLFVRAPSAPTVKAGDELVVRGVWTRDERGEALNAVSFDLTAPREAGARGWAWRVIDRLADHQELAGSLLLGRGSPPEKPLFKATGLIHILAVSGVHLAIAAGMTIWLLRLFSVSWAVRLAVLGGLVIGYTWLTGASPATVRALAMTLAVIAYDALAREPHSLGAVSLAALVLVLLVPGMATDLGFQLSLAAVLGIVTLGRDLVRWREEVAPLQPWPLDRPSWRAVLFALRSTWDGLALGLAATLATAPLLAAHIGAVAPWSALTTLLAAPPSTAALWLGLPLLTLGGLWPNGPWAGLYAGLEYCLAALVWAVECALLLPGRQVVTAAPALVSLAWPLVFIPGGMTGKTLLCRLGLAAALIGIWAWW